MALSDERRRRLEEEQQKAVQNNLRAAAERDAATFDRLERLRAETQRYNQNLALNRAMADYRQQARDRAIRTRQEDIAEMQRVADVTAEQEAYDRNLIGYNQYWKSRRDALDAAEKAADQQRSTSERKRDYIRSSSPWTRRVDEAKSNLPQGYELGAYNGRTPYDRRAISETQRAAIDEYEAAKSRRDAIAQEAQTQANLADKALVTDIPNQRTMLEYERKYMSGRTPQEIAARLGGKLDGLTLNRGKEIAREVMQEYSEPSKVFGTGAYFSINQFGTDEEKAIILRMAENGQWDDIERYYDALTPELNERRYGHVTSTIAEMPERRKEALEQYGNVMGNIGYAEGKLGQAVYGTFRNMEAPAAYAQILMDTARSKISKANGGPNYYTDLNADAVGRVRTGNFARAESLKNFNETGQLVGNAIYSTIDNLLQMPLGPQRALIAMALSAAGQTAIQTLERGGTQGQASLMGAVNGAIEYLTEKLPIDNFFEVLNTQGRRGLLNALRDWLSVAFPEAAEEYIGSLASTLADRYIMGSQSEYDEYLQKLQKEDKLSYSEAKKQAFKQFFQIQPLNEAAAGAISGAALGGVSVAGQRLNQRGIDLATGWDITDNRRIADVVLDEGMKSTDKRIRDMAYNLDAIRKENNEDYQWSTADQRRIGEIYDSLDNDSKARVGQEAGIREAEREAEMRQKIAEQAARDQEERDRNMTPDEFDEEIRRRAEASGNNINMDNPETMVAEEPAAETEQTTRRGSDEYTDRVETPEDVDADLRRRAAAAEEATRTGDTSALEQLDQEPVRREQVQTEAASQTENAPQTEPAAQTTRDYTPEQAARQTADNARRAGLSAEDTLVMSNIARDVGARLEFQQMRNSRIHGFYNRETGTIVLNQDLSTAEMAWSTFAHEITHHSESAGSYKQLAALAKRFVGETAGTGDEDDAWNSYIRQKRRQYADVGYYTSQQDAEFEAVANTIENILTSREAMEGVARYSREDAQALLASIDDVLDRSTTNNTAITPESARLVQAQKALAAALGEVREQRATQTESATATQTTGNSPDSEGTLMTDGNGEPIKQYSISTAIEPLGLDFTKDENGKTILLDNNGNAVDNITEDMIWRSDYGAIIKATMKTAQNPNGILTEKEADSEIKFLADTIKMMLDTQDVDLIWAVNSTIGFQPIEPGQVIKASKGKSKFAALTPNADPQYGTTVDFTTICLKTQAVIDVMSKVMKDHKSGLTRDEIVKIVYDETAKAGEPVPCPVCYVFSRWVGLGGLFDTIYKMQNEYPEDMDISNIRTDLAALKKTIEAFAGKNFSDKKNHYYRDIVKEQSALAKKQFDAENLNGEPLTKAEKARLETLTKQIRYIDQWAWLNTVRLDKNYKPVPPDILFDINAGKTFADEYPVTWKYRTTRGNAMGKAATPYADEHIGQIISGIATPALVTDKKLGDLSNDPFFGTEGKLGETALKTLTTAQMNARKQNLLNGQRLQSTSDFRYEYALDYLMAFFELQSAGAKAQMYTKVPEMVSMAASCRIETNLSLMPLNDGYDEDGNLIFSDVTGMSAEDAFRYSAMYDCVQPIIVGINPKHVRLCMRDPRITFCIPYHSSGNSEDRYVSMMKSVGETVKDRVDFSDYENDTIMKDATPEQKAAYSARMKILTGDAENMTEAEISAVQNNEILGQLLIRFYGTDIDGNEARVDDMYLNPDDKKSGRDSETYHTFLTASMAEKIMPYEFWDKNNTRATERVNGDRFVDYCNSLGVHARFSGWNKNGVYHADMDFTNEDGYWKVIPDRKMYNNDGTYHVQQAVNISNFQAEYLLPSEADKNIVKPSRANDRSKVSDIADKAWARISEARANESTKYKLGMESPKVQASLAGNNWEADVKEAVRRYGRMKPGEQLYYTDKNGNKVKATDESFLPKGTSEDTRIRGFQRTAIESRNVKADTRDLAVANQYRPTSNEENIQKAIERRGNGSFDLALGEWNTLVKSGRLSYKNLSVDIAFGERLLLEAQQEGNVDAVRSIITDLAEIGTTFGQATQAFSLLKRMSPEGQLIQMERQGKNYYDKLNRKGKYTNKKAARQVKYTDDLGKAADAMERLDEAKKQLSNIQKDKNHTAAQIKAAKAKIASINNEIKQVLAELSKTKQDWKHTKGILIREQLTRSELNREIKATKDRIQNALDGIKKTQTDIDRLQGELWALENKETNKKADRDALREKRKELKRQRDNMMSRIETLSRQIPQLQADIDAMFSQMAIGEDNEADMKSYRDTLRESRDIMKDYLRYVKQKGTVVIPTDLSNEYINAKTDEERAAVQLKIDRCIADQLPGTWEERIRAVRYISMLFNPTTHLRNISGNAMQYSMVKARDVFATLGEKAFLRNGEERYHAFLSSKKGADAKYWDAADADYKEMMDIVQGNRTDVGAHIEEMRRIFKTDFGEKIRRTSGETLEAEDRFWLSRHYKSAFAQYLKANKLDPANLTDEQLDRARSIAVDQAQKATYRDYSTFADQLNRLEKSSGAAEFFMGGLMPFKKTPINVLKRGVEYSPLGAIKTVADFVKLKRGNTTVTAADVINDAAQTLTGTLATALGVLLGAMGWAHASPGEDDNKKKKNFDKESGMQNYSIEIPGFDENGNWRWKAGTYTVDWLSPFSMPLFIGVRIAEMVKGQDSGLHSFEDIVDAASSIAEPIFQLSMLDGLTSALQSYQTSGAGVSRALLWSVVESYALQFFPTLGSKMARIIDPTQRSTKAFKYSTWFGQDIERLYRRILAKIPGATYALKPVIDQHGDIKKNVGSNVIERIGYNLASPGYYKYKSTDEADAETRRVYEALAGEDPELANSVLSRDINTYWELNGEKYYLNAEEYRKFSETQGKEETAGRKELYASEAYRNATDAEKAAMIKKVIDAAQEKAKIGFFEDIGVDNDYYRSKLNDSVYNKDGSPKNLQVVTDMYENGSIDLGTIYQAEKAMTGITKTGAKIDTLNQMIQKYNLTQDEYDFLYMTKIANQYMQDDMQAALDAGGTLDQAINTVARFYKWDANAVDKTTGEAGMWVKYDKGTQAAYLSESKLSAPAKEAFYLNNIVSTNNVEKEQEKIEDYYKRNLSFDDYLQSLGTKYDDEGTAYENNAGFFRELYVSDLSAAVKEAAVYNLARYGGDGADKAQADINAYKKSGLTVQDYILTKASLYDDEDHAYTKTADKAKGLLESGLSDKALKVAWYTVASDAQGAEDEINVFMKGGNTVKQFLKAKAATSAEGMKSADKAKAILDLDLKSFTSAITSIVTTSENKAEGIAAALNAGIKDRDVATAYAKYAEINAREDLNGTGKAREFAMWLDRDTTMSRLSAEQKAIMKDAFRYYNMVAADAGKYDSLMKVSGMSSKSAESISKDLSALEPLPGAKSVSESQRRRAIAYNTTASEKEIDAAMYLQLDSTDDGKEATNLTNYKRAREAGLSAKQYVDYSEKLATFTSDRDANGKEITGRKKQDKIVAYINGLPISRAQKNALWFLAGYKESTLKKQPWY